MPLFCFVTSSGLSRLGHEAEGAFGVSRDHGAMDFFGANDLTHHGLDGIDGTDRRAVQIEML